MLSRIGQSLMGMGRKEEEDSYPMMGQLSQNISDFPVLQNPNKLQRISGFLSALGGQPSDVTNEIMWGPNNRAMQQWSLKNNALSNAAKIEGSNVSNKFSNDLKRMNNESLANYRQTQGEAALGRVGNAADANRIRQDDLANRNRIANAKLELDKWKTMNPEGKIYAPKGGNVMLVNPLTGESIDTGIETGSLTDEERIKLTGAVQQQNIAAQGEQARTTKSTPSADSGVNSQLPTQQKQAILNRAQQLINQRPDLAAYITINPNTNAVEIAPAGKTNWMGQQRGPSKEQFDEINNIIYGAGSGGLPPKVPVTPSNKPVNQEPIGGQKKRADGAILMTAPNGVDKRWVTPDKMTIARQQGFK